MVSNRERSAGPLSAACSSRKKLSCTWAGGARADEEAMPRTRAASGPHSGHSLSLSDMRHRWWKEHGVPWCAHAKCTDGRSSACPHAEQSRVCTTRAWVRSEEISARIRAVSSASTPTTPRSSLMRAASLARARVMKRFTSASVAFGCCASTWTTTRGGRSCSASIRSSTLPTSFSWRAGWEASQWSASTHSCGSEPPSCSHVSITPRRSPRAAWWSSRCRYAGGPWRARSLTSPASKACIRHTTIAPSTSSLALASAMSARACSSHSFACLPSPREEHAARSAT
mmetsp:Transcript_34727/g.82471  ORF Transcript_34727/g.82471 Transcript_34727/m.82471 type:complete len:285 (+) Transcript_34727:171-1025(+)